MVSFLHVFVLNFACIALMPHSCCVCMFPPSCLPLFDHRNNGRSRSQWPRGLRRRSGAACLLRSWVRIPPGAWMSVCCECCVLSGRGLCDELITRPEESYRLWCVIVCDLETSRMRRPWPALGRSATKKIQCMQIMEIEWPGAIRTLFNADRYIYANKRASALPSSLCDYGHAGGFVRILG